MHLRLFQTVLLPLALVTRSTAGNSAECDSTPVLDQMWHHGPSTLSSTFSVWSERLFSLLDPNDAEPPTGRLRAFANDLHLAFVAPRHATRPPHKQRKPHPNSGLLRRADSQWVTKCKVQSSGLGSSQGDDDPKSTSTTLPGMTPTDSNGRPLPTQTVSEGHGGGGRETIAVTQPCGNIPVGASSKEFPVPCNNSSWTVAVDVRATTGPNGQQAWLTCGISLEDKTSGWNPPNATIDQVITLEGGLRAAVKMDGSPYKACTDYLEIFEAAGGEFGSKHPALVSMSSSFLMLCQVPPLFIAAFALQESSCNPTTMGQGGEAGMMQISPVIPILSCLRRSSSPHTNRTSVPTRLTVIVWMYGTTSGLLPLISPMSSKLTVAISLRQSVNTMVGTEACPTTKGSLGV